MGFAVLGTIALVLLVVGLAIDNERLYMISSPFWMLLGFYCFSTLYGINPVTVWVGWLGIFSILGGMYIIWDVVWGEFGKKRERNRNANELEETDGFSEIDRDTKRKRARANRPTNTSISTRLKALGRRR